MHSYLVTRKIDFLAAEFGKKDYQVEEIEEIVNFEEEHMKSERIEAEMLEFALEAQKMLNMESEELRVI